MPQISPISWTIIVTSLIIFLSVINSNIPNPHNIGNLENKVSAVNNVLNW